MISKNPPNSEKLPLVYVANHSTPITDEQTADNQFRNMLSGWQDGDHYCQCKTFLSIVPVVYSSLPAQPALPPHLLFVYIYLQVPKEDNRPAHPFRCKPELRAPKCSYFLGESPALMPSLLPECEFHHLNLGKRKN